MNNDNKKSNSTKDKNNKNQLEKSIDKNLSKGNCNNKKIPINQVIDQVEAFNGKIKADDPKLIYKNDKNQFLSKELPKSFDTVKSRLIEDKFKEYQDLLKKISLDINPKKLQKSFIQIKILEKYFKDKNYRPYLNLLEIKKNKNLKNHKNLIRK